MCSVDLENQNDKKNKKFQKNTLLPWLLLSIMDSI